MIWPANFSGLAAATPFISRPLHLAIGMFDGVHLGHCAVIGAAVQSARHTRGHAMVLTMWPHPSVVFRPDHPTRLILDAPARSQAMFEIGVDAVIVEPFTPAFMQIQAEDFLPHVRRQLPTLAGVYAGENFRFGKSRQGDVELLIRTGRQLGLEVFSAPRVNYQGEPISSSRIRACLEAGGIGEANAMLGHAYTASGVVVPGRQLGRTLGFPTLNLPWTPDLQPRYGVYAVRVTGPISTQSEAGGMSLPTGEPIPQSFPAVANYGLRPTIEEAGTTPLLEIHLLAACPFGPGDTLKVEWLHFLRPEQKFAVVSDLRSQIAQDCKAAKAFFSLP